MKTLTIYEDDELLALPPEMQEQAFLDLCEVLDTEAMRRRRQVAAQVLYERSTSPWGRSAQQVLDRLEARAGRKVMGKSRFHDIRKGRSGGRYPAVLQQVA